MTVRVYRSTDTGAPQLTGTAGSLVAVLDACLVNGYNSNNPAGSGWSIAFTGTNQRIYRQPAGSNQFYLRVDDSTGGTYAQVFGAETATAIGVGSQTGLFPTTAQQASPGLFWVKSNAAGAATRGWIVVATQKMIYLWITTNNIVPPSGSVLPILYWFGDITSYKVNSFGYQYAQVGSNKSYSAATGYTAGTTYTATITIDGVGYPISALGSTISTFQTLIDTINAAITTNGTAYLAGGNILIASATTGLTSTVAITAGTLFALPLIGFTGLSTAVTGLSSTDAYGTVIGGLTTSSFTGSSIADAISLGNGAFTSIQPGRFICRSYTQAGTSATWSLYSNAVLAGTTTAGANTANKPQFPEPMNQSLILAPLWIIENLSTGPVRGIMPGLWSVQNKGTLKMSTIANGDVFQGTDTLAGKTFETVWSSTSGQLQIETSDTW